MLGLIFLGILYALPNLYGDDPALQISTTEKSDWSVDELSKKVQAVLDSNQLAYQKIEVDQHNLLVRFFDTQTQIRSRDLVKAELGKNIVAALNLAPRTPHWLQAIGAHPMKLGLDLSGGVHFLLAVDVDSVIDNHLKADRDEIKRLLRENHVRYLKMDLKQQTLVTYFRTVKDHDQASQLLAKHFQNYVILPSVKGGDRKLLIALRQQMLNNLINYSVEQTVMILTNRVNELGVSEALVQRQGLDKVSVDLPGIQDTARAKELIGKTATLRFQMVDIEHDIQKAMEGIVPLGSEIQQYNERPILLKRQIILGGDSITYAASGMDENGQPEVSIRLGGGHESIFHQTTADNIGKPLAVVYTEPKVELKKVGDKIERIRTKEERVISVATIRSALGNSFNISGLSSMNYASNLALLLRSGALVAPLTFVQEQLVGPSLGHANIHKGILSVEIGCLLVFLFMMMYYRVFGVIANFALVMNMVFIVALLSLIGATLTLAGIAGIVLTVGMAVDANVLIYERIREELSRGISVQAAIHAGYEKAFATIVDANVTTLIVALVLFALGSAQVKGFAVSITIGLLASMVTAIFFTRAIVNICFGGKKIESLPIGVVIKSET